MNNKFLFPVIAVAAMALTACGTAKHVTTQPATGDNTTTTTIAAAPVETILASLGNWHTMQAGGNITLKVGSNFSSSIQMRMVRDEAIYISLRPMLGIEVGRLLITADSLYAVDKVHKRYIAEKVSLLTAGVPVTVSDMQDIFLGRPRIIGKGTLSQELMPQVTARTEGATLVIKPNETFKGYGYAYLFDQAAHLSSLAVAREGSTQNALGVSYGNVRNTAAGNIAHSVSTTASVKGKKLEFSLTYKNIDWNGNVKIDRNLPSGYTRMQASDLFSLFAN